MSLEKKILKCLSIAQTLSVATSGSASGDLYSCEKNSY